MSSKGSETGFHICDAAYAGVGVLVIPVAAAKPASATVEPDYKKIRGFKKSKKFQ